jgi:hypothetical protein
MFVTAQLQLAVHGVQGVIARANAKGYSISKIGTCHLVVHKVIGVAARVATYLWMLHNLLLQSVTIAPITLLVMCFTFIISSHSLHQFHIHHGQPSTALTQLLYSYYLTDALHSTR